MRLRLTPAFTVCLAFASVLGGAASRNAAGGADFVRLTPDQVSWRDLPDGHGAQLATIAENLGEIKGRLNGRAEERATLTDLDPKPPPHRGH